MSQPKSPSLNALRAFEAVARLSSLKLAALELGVTQSAVSRQLTALEQQLDTRLIFRDNKVHSLTETGKILAPELTTLFRRLDNLIHFVQNKQDQQKQIIRLGVSDELLQYWFTKHIQSIREIFLSLEFQFFPVPEYVHQGNQEQLLYSLLNFEVDCIFIFGHYEHSQLTQFPLAQIDLQQYTYLDTTDPTECLPFIAKSNQPSESFINHASTTSKAAIAQAQGLAFEAPALYQLEQHLPSLQKRLANTKQAALSAYIRKGSDTELGIAALITWLSYHFNTEA